MEEVRERARAVRDIVLDTEIFSGAARVMGRSEDDGASRGERGRGEEEMQGGYKE